MDRPDLMRRLGFTLLISGVFLGLAWQAFKWCYPNRGPRVQYRGFRGDDPRMIRMTFAPPSGDLDSIPETSITHELRPGELLSLEGGLSASSTVGAPPIVVQIVDQSSGEDVTANSAAVIPEGDPKQLKIRINVPEQAGDYELRMMWGSEFIARGKLRVVATQ